MSAERETVSGVQTQRRVYAYDDASNRTQQTAAGSENYQISYEYDRSNRLMSESKTGGSGGTYTYTYDHNGNQLRKKSGGTTLESRQYNGLNQLTGLTAGSAAVAYAYNPSGLRAAKTVNGTQTQYILDGENTILELSSGSVRKYVRGQDLILSTSGGDTRYYLYNAHGDVTQLTDSAGNIVKSYEYDAFGNEKNPVPSDPNPFRYAGEYFDKETGTYYLRERYYDPVTSRMLSEDPARDGLNWYVYANNNPLKYIDPSGLRAVLAVAGEDRASNHNAFINNINTFIANNPDDTVIIVKAWDYSSESALMSAIISQSNDMGGIDVLLLESHGTSGSLIVSGSYSLGKSANWAGINLNEGANIRFSGCNTGGYDGAVSSTSIAQHVANETQRIVWAYVNNTSQTAYDKNGNVTTDWRQLPESVFRIRYGGLFCVQILNIY